MFSLASTAVFGGRAESRPCLLKPGRHGACPFSASPFSPRSRSPRSTLNRDRGESPASAPLGQCDFRDSEPRCRLVPRRRTCVIFVILCKVWFFSGGHTLQRPYFAKYGTRAPTCGVSAIGRACCEIAFHPPHFNALPKRPAGSIVGFQKLRARDGRVRRGLRFSLKELFQPFNQPAHIRAEIRIRANANRIARRQLAQRLRQRFGGGHFRPADQDRE